MGFSGGIQPPHRKVMGFVDAGYLKARLEAGTTERPVEINGVALTAVMGKLLQEAPGSNELIRTYVYDAEHEATHPQHREQRERFDRLAAVGGITLRLGHLTERSHPKKGPRYEQKGVDTLLVLDLLRMAQREAYDIAVLCTGDRDFAEVVRAVCDDYGRRVWLFTPDRSSVAKELLHGVDRVFDLVSVETIRIASSPGTTENE